MSLRQMGGNEIIPYLLVTIYFFSIFIRNENETSLAYNLKMKKHVVLAVILLFAIQIGGCQRVNLENTQLTGLNKSEVIELLGEPDEVEELVKSTEYIFGPIEGLWDQIGMGEKILIWRYETWNGFKELYFINNSPKVIEEFFWYKDSRKNPVF